MRRDDRVLDLGTGTGALLRELAGRDARPAEVVGIDRSASMLARVDVRLPDGWRAIWGDARRLAFDDHRFDVVTASYLLHLLDPGDRERVLREIARVLRPGGSVVTVTVHSTRPLTRAMLELLPRWSGLRSLDPTDELVAAGLVPLRARFVSAGWPSLCVLATA